MALWVWLDQRVIVLKWDKYVTFNNEMLVHFGFNWPNFAIFPRGSLLFEESHDFWAWMWFLLCGSIYSEYTNCDYILGGLLVSFHLYNFKYTNCDYFLGRLLVSFQLYIFKYTYLLKAHGAFMNDPRPNLQDWSAPLHIRHPPKLSTSFCLLLFSQ